MIKPQEDNKKSGRIWMQEDGLSKNLYSCDIIIPDLEALTKAR